MIFKIYLFIIFNQPNREYYNFHKPFVPTLTISMFQLLLQSIMAFKVLLDKSITFESYEKFPCKRYAENETDYESDKVFQLRVNIERIAESNEDGLLYVYTFASKYLFCITKDNKNVIEDGIIENKEELEEWLEKRNITGIYLISKMNISFYHSLRENINKKLDRSQLKVIFEGSDSDNEDSDTDLEEMNHFDSLFKNMVRIEVDEKDVIIGIEKQFVELPADNNFNEKTQIVFNELNRILINNLFERNKFLLTKKEFEAILNDSVFMYMKHLANHVEYLEAFYGLGEILRS